MCADGLGERGRRGPKRDKDRGPGRARRKGQHGAAGNPQHPPTHPPRRNDERSAPLGRHGPRAGRGQTGAHVRPRGGDGVGWEVSYRVATGRPSRPAEPEGAESGRQGRRGGRDGKKKERRRSTIWPPAGRGPFPKTPSRFKTKVGAHGARQLLPALRSGLIRFDGQVSSVDHAA